MIQFFLNQKPLDLDSTAPTQSVLDWLRTNKGLTGTKEGCASGDCGACTVVIGEKRDSAMHYFTANACLMLMSSLHGRQLITIEHINDSSNNQPNAPEQLHPVQRAMVECHGSQCGFCTPGFIMSLFALYQNYENYPGKARAIEALGGNLCRCTGYRPILEAAKKAFSYPRASNIFDNDALVKGLSVIQANTQNVEISFNNSKIEVPNNLADLLAYNACEPEVKMIAGGTDLSLEFTQMLKSYEQLIDISQVSELQTIEETNSMLIIGAAASYSAFMPLLFKHYPSSEEVFKRIGSEQVRNKGTLGGSLGNASPIGDPAPLLIALHANMVLARLENGDVVTRTVKVEDFFTGYRQTVLDKGEVIAEIHIPKPGKNSEVFFYKLSKRYEDDISAVCLALNITVNDGIAKNVKTGFGGMAAIPAAGTTFDQALTGQAFTLNNIEAAAQLLSQDFTPMSDVRASANYRLEAAKNLMTRAWYESQFNTESHHTSTKVRVSHA